jgi:glycosyltransferase involved in cell wall biosynthesis
MIVQVFNSGVVSGPETLVLPAIPLFHEPHVVVFLVEKRRGAGGRAPLEYARSLGLRVEAVEVESRFDRRAVGRLRAVLRALSPRVVHAHDVKASTYTWLASRGENWKCISTHHGVGGRPDWITKAYEYFYSQFILPRMSFAIAVSESDRATLLGRGLDSQRTVFVKNGITRTRWEGAERVAERARIRSEWAREIPGLSPGDVLLGMVARLSAEKRHSYFLQTLAELERARPGLPWRLVAVGAGNLEEVLKRETRKLGLEKKVHWLGYLEEASKLMPALDALVFTSSAEGLPISALEAGWAGIPLFASAVGALPELIGSGVNAGGIFFPREQEPANTAASLAGLVENTVERGRMGLALQNRVASDYSAEAWVNRMESIYRAV